MKQTVFFTLMKDLCLNTTSLNISITKLPDDKYAVQVISKLAGEHADDQPKEISPIVLRGTAEELDEGFFEGIKPPIEKVNGLYIDLTGHDKGLAEAKEEIEDDKKTEQDRKNRAANKSKSKSKSKSKTATKTSKPAASKEEVKTEKPKAEKVEKEKPKSEKQLAEEAIVAELEKYKKLGAEKKYDEALAGLKEYSKTQKDSRVFHLIMTLTNERNIASAPKLELDVEETPKTDTPAKEEKAEEVKSETNPE